MLLEDAIEIVDVMESAVSGGVFDGAASSQQALGVVNTNGVQVIFERCPARLVKAPGEVVRRKTNFFCEGFDLERFTETRLDNPQEHADRVGLRPPRGRLGKVQVPVKVGEQLDQQGA